MSSESSIKEVIFEKIPRDAKIVGIEMEGPTIAVYVENLNFLAGGQQVLAEVAKQLRKRIIVRSAASVRAPKEETETIIRQVVPQEAGLEAIVFNEVFGEVLVSVRNPDIVEELDEKILNEILVKTGWKPVVIRIPPLSTTIIPQVMYVFNQSAEERFKILREVGERIFRRPLFKTEGITLTFLGGAEQVGRSSILVSTDESNVLMDFGINPAANIFSDAFPRIDRIPISVENIDAVVISHAHLDHMGGLPLLFKYGYRGPVYMTEPTVYLMFLLLNDLYDVLQKNGVTPFFELKDLRTILQHTIPVKFGVVVDIAPDIKLTFRNAGHILGSAIIHLHVGEGLHNIVFTGDLKYDRSILLEHASTTFPRVETLITECTYGGQNDVMPPREEVENRLISLVNSTLDKNGNVLIPTLAVGRAQEIMLILDNAIRSKKIPEVPIYVDGMISEVTAIHASFPNYLSKDLRSLMNNGLNPFKSEYVIPVKNSISKEEITESRRNIILSPSGMLEGGPVLEYFKLVAPQEESTIVFVNYQIEGTLGNRVLNGLRELTLQNSSGKVEALTIKSTVEKVDGFSGHSDRNQLLNYVRRVYTKRGPLFLVHGEAKKIQNMKRMLSRVYGDSVYSPRLLETYRAL
ncbi:MAG: beta-CASP ribonuclease aCPSF1 [Candidatus Brockarchaeota archaeon]|nr:beta-CASP ribonuclease aCPSF1 [Candidatus Brockarchaeota archaeon]